jgi:predicted 3-demethylubiquinone-9 3-methyltransferase (glyoxalase superfamily)
LKDRYGVSWQVVPVEFEELICDPDQGRRDRAMKAMLGMRKLDVAAIKAAANRS